jgi:putative SOS response-associated peptidase YedK
VALLRWGLVPFWAKDLKIGTSMINARSEGIEAKPAFRRRGEVAPLRGPSHRVLRVAR